MRTPRQQLILDLLVRRISEEEFLREIGIARENGSGFALSMLEEAYREHNWVDVECGLAAPIPVVDETKRCRRLAPSILLFRLMEISHQLGIW